MVFKFSSKITFNYNKIKHFNAIQYNLTTEQLKKDLKSNSLKKFL